MKKLNNKINNSKITKYIVNKKLYILVVILTSIIIPSLIFSLINDYSITNYIFLFINIIIFIYGTMLNIKINKDKMEYMFINIFIPIGVFMAIFILPGFIYDEGAHFYRAYDISNGNIMTIGNNYNIKAPKVIADYLEDKQVHSYGEVYYKLSKTTDYNDLVSTNTLLNRALSYSAISYTIPAIVLLIGRTFNINIFLCFFIAKILNL